MAIYFILLIGLSLTVSCKPRLEKSGLLEGQTTPTVTLGGSLQGVVVPAATPGAWAFGKKPSAVTLWPEPEGQQLDKHGRLSWPTNWPLSPTGAMPYEKLYSHKRDLNEGRVVVGDDDYHFDCDDFALSYHRWCKFNAGKQCYSLRVNGLEVGEHTTVRYNLEQKNNTEITTTEVSSENPPAWANDFIGTFKIPDIDVFGSEVYKSTLVFKGQRYSYAELSDYVDGVSWQNSFACESKTKKCSFAISYAPGRPYIEVTHISHDKKEGHIMIAHEVQGNNAMRKYCLVEYYFWPEISGDKPYVYGCWSQSREEKVLKIPPRVIDKIASTFGSKSNYEVDWVSAQPEHSGVVNEFTFTHQKVRGDNIKIATLPNTSVNYDVAEPEYNRLKTTGFIFSYLTGLDPHSLAPLDRNEISKRYLDNPRALEIYFVLSGQFPQARKQKGDPFRDDSNVGDRPFGDVRRAIFELGKRGELSK